MNRFIEIHCQFFLCFNRRNKCLPPPLQLVCSFLRSKLVMNNFQSACLFHSTVRRSAIWTINDLASHGIDALGEGLPLHIFQVGSPESFQIYPTVRFVEQDTRTCLCHNELWNVSMVVVKRLTLQIAWSTAMVCLK